MKPISLVGVLIILATSTGCTVSDALFSVFGDHYSGGGYTWEDKHYDYDRKLEAARDYGSSLP